MKIGINNVKLVPENVGTEGFCVFGSPNEIVQEWINHWGFTTEQSGKFTNIIIPSHIKLVDVFDEKTPFEYVDGFSPNLNKHLHLGHAANLIIGKALYNLGVAKQTVAILGDTLDGAVSNDEALATYNNLCAEFGYPVQNLFFASQQQSLSVDASMVAGQGQYVGCQVIEVDAVTNIVGKRSTGETTYFYQDMVLAEKLNAPTLYLTGTEQIPHFENLSKLVPTIKHIGLGLVLNNGQKMSSRLNNVIFFDDILAELAAGFEDNRELAYNILAGQILKYDLPTAKNIVKEQLTNLQNSTGLYLSYTNARLVKVGIPVEETTAFNSQKLQYLHLMAKNHLAPHQLLKGLFQLCSELNYLYNTKRVQGNPENISLFTAKLADLQFGMKQLGLFIVDKV